MNLFLCCRIRDFGIFMEFLLFLVIFKYILWIIFERVIFLVFDILEKLDVFSLKIFFSFRFFRLVLGLIIFFILNFGMESLILVLVMMLGLVYCKSVFESSCFLIWRIKKERKLCFYFNCKRFCLIKNMKYYCKFSFEVCRCIIKGGIGFVVLLCD